MDEARFYTLMFYAWLGLAAVTFVLLFFVTAPYGRFLRQGWGPRLPARWSWVLQEAPAVFAFAAFYLLGERRLEPVPLIAFGLWMAHYLHRTFIFPFRLRGGTREATWATTLMAIAFNLGNAYLNGRALTALGPVYPPEWLHDPRFLGGVALFVAGYAINRHADHVLIHLRAPGETGYKIPRGGLYRWVSCPNYLGEILEWGGFALAFWNLGALAFLVWTAANLAPRAFATHRWYRAQFPDYPPERKALLPFLA